MLNPINRELIIDFIFNKVSEEDSENLVEAIKSDDVIKEWYLFEKRRVDIENYISDDLSFGESLELKELLKNDSKLNMHFELSQRINSTIKMQSFAEQLKTIHEELYGAANKVIIAHQERIKRSNASLKRWIVAASVTLLVTTIGSLYILRNETPLEKRLYASYYQPFSNNSKNFFKSTPIIEAKNKYSSQEYDDALVILQNMPNSIQIRSEKLLYTGLSLMELGRYKEAIEKFNSVIYEEDYVVTSSIAQWYTALCYVKVNDIENAKIVLTDIIKYKGYNFKKALRLYKKLG